MALIDRCYYRCPVALEDRDKDYPRFFVMAQLISYNALADAVTVRLHDILGSRAYYSDIFRHAAFPARSVDRCEAVPGGQVEGPWGRGTIEARAAEPYADDQPYWYWVRLPDGRHVKCCETELKIEYSQMYYPPEKQLRAYEFQHPTWFLNRLKVARNCHVVDHAAYGFQVLAGCRTHMLPHQVATVARCFESRPVRYMLADEVGLGKTVEACSILTILRSENARLRALIIVPDALVSQWENELHYKFALQADGDAADPQLCILSLEELTGKKRLLEKRWDIVIVDETHRLLDHREWYDHIQALSRRTEHILLLSATPIQDRKEEYKALLALLSPEQYASMSSERFAWMVEKQKHIQNVADQQLRRLDRYEEYKEIIADKLTDIAEMLDDRALTELTRGVDLQSDDGGLAQVKQTLAYICENYRVERRVIRNRRQLIGEHLARRTLVPVPYTPLSLDENYNETGVIDGVLAYLTEKGRDDESYVADTAIPLLAALFSSPWALEETLRALRINDKSLLGSVSVWKRQAENEHMRADHILEEEPELIKGRLMRAMDYIDQETDIEDEACKIVVFTAHSATLREFMRLFGSRYDGRGIYAVAFSSQMERQALEDSVYAFQNDKDCRVIVCDETGGEGRNVQEASLIIHLDMPWNANALEQRIGRLDRLGRDPEKDVLSVVLYAEGTAEEQLFRIWKEGLKLFERSLSGLEIITGELDRLILDALRRDYHTGLANAFEDILDQAEQMRESVEDEQDFDLGAALYRPLSREIGHVLDMYAEENGNPFAMAMLGWSGQAGLGAQRPDKDGLIEFRESAFSVNAAKQSLFVPPDWERYRGASIMRREGKILGTFDRRTAAVREDVLFFAPGDSVYDAIIMNAMGCSRGRCSALLIHGGFDYDGFIFIYDIQPKIDELLESGMDLLTLQQYKMYLSLEQVVVPIGLTEASRKVPDDRVIRALFSAAPHSAEHLGRRGAGRLSMSPLERFMSRLPADEWEPLVSGSAALAYRKAAAEVKRRSRLREAKKEMERVLYGRQAEKTYFGRGAGDNDEEKQKFRATVKALKAAEPVLDAACFLLVRKNGQ